MSESRNMLFCDCQEIGLADRTRDTSEELSAKNWDRLPSISLFLPEDEPTNRNYEPRIRRFNAKCTRRARMGASPFVIALSNPVIHDEAAVTDKPEGYSHAAGRRQIFI